VACCITVTRKRSREIAEKIAGDAHVCITNHKEMVFGELFELEKFGDFGVGADEWAADDKPCVRSGILLDKFSNDVAHRIVGRSDTEEDLNRSGVVLCEPAPETFFGVRVAAFQRLE